MVKRREFLLSAGVATISGPLSAFSSHVERGTTRLSSNSPRVESASPSLNLVHERHWHIGDTDECTHVLGNGQAMVHELGPNIVYFRAPWISSPNLLTMTLVSPAEIRTVSSREQGTNIWHHKLTVGADAVGEIVDFLEEGQPCLRRMISSRVELVFAVWGPRLVDYSDRYQSCGSLIGQWPCGTDIFFDFRSTNSYTVQLVFPKNTQFKIGERASQPRQLGTIALDLPRYETLLRFAPGCSDILLVADAGIAECLSAIDHVLVKPAEQSLTRVRESWRSRLSKISWTGTYENTVIPIESVIDDVGTLLLGHRSQAGPVAAGPIYPLFYVRDQYSVSRALLALNMHDHAKAILSYYYSIYTTHGRIHNAQSDGPYHWFHRAENDDVEITGYLIIQAFDYLKATRDEDFIEHIFPMLKWALVAQESQLLGNMLPFNGDETYVAGGIFPRTHLNDGASEATLLYLASAERLLVWATARKLRPEEVLQHRQTLTMVKRAYTRNFTADGKLTINNSSRRELGSLPRFRYGVCLGQYDDNCLFLSTTELAEDGRYFCYSCYPQRTKEAYEPKTYFIPSVALTSSLIDYSAVTQDVTTATLMEAVSVFAKNGHFTWTNRKLPGFEMAMISLALLKDRDPRANEFVQRMLELRDPTGAWAEYYNSTAPQGCRCRPWESSLGLLALIKSANSTLV